MPRRSLFNQFNQVRGTRAYEDLSSYAELAETTGRSYLTGTLAVVSGSNQITDSSNNFDKYEQNNFIVITSGVAAGVYTILSGSGSSTATVSPTPTATDATASYRRHYYQNLEDDLNYVRTMVNRIVGDSNWYDVPGTDLRDLTDHTHTESDVTDLDKYTQAEVDALVAGQNEFIELIDTPSSYTDKSVLFTTTSGVVDDVNFTFDSNTTDLTLTSGRLVSERVDATNHTETISTALGTLTTAGRFDGYTSSVLEYSAGIYATASGGATSVANGGIFVASGAALNQGIYVTAYGAPAAGNNWGIISDLGPGLAAGTTNIAVYANAAHETGGVTVDKLYSVYGTAAVTAGAANVVYGGWFDAQGGPFNWQLILLMVMFLSRIILPLVVHLTLMLVRPLMRL
ncbi:MAG: hypothetical protein DRQ47_11055 [Gammaproteobacteria bacterium]|nr:MAG: hypothetical protein DRQ47_11055 [Gammaproteobacteria bacterium]